MENNKYGIDRVRTESFRVSGCGILFSVSLIILGQEASQNSYVIANIQLDRFKPVHHVESDGKRCSDLILRLWHLLHLLGSLLGIVFCLS